MDQQQVQELIDLTPAQMKAWKALESAVKLCKKEKIFFYQCLDTLHGLNGRNVKNVVGDEKSDGMQGRDECCLQWLSYPSVTTACSFADDNHYVVLKD